MRKLFENVEGNRFKLISEGISEDEPKSSLIRQGLKKVFSEGEQEYSYKKLECIGLGYIRNVSEAKKCALQEARELALEFGYKDNEDEQKFVKEGITDPVAQSISGAMSNAFEEKREVQIGKELLLVHKHVLNLLNKNSAGKETVDYVKEMAKSLQMVKQLAEELIEMHSPNGPVVKPGTGPNALYKPGSIY